MRRGLLNIIYISFLLVFVSCSVSKFVPEGKYLLDDVKVVSDSKEVKPSSVRSYVRQRPNAKWFSLIKIPLYTYSLSGRDSTKRFNRFLRRIGDAPVIYDENAEIRSQEELTKALNNMGYMSASVSTEKKVVKKKLKLTYKLNPGKGYKVRNITYDIKDHTIEKYLQADSANRKIHEGMMFDVNILDAERQRIVDFLLRRGYYKFNKDYITYTADTARNTYLVDITLRISLFKASPADVPKEHYQYRINSVSYMMDYDILKSSVFDKDINDSIKYKGYPVYFKDKLFLRPKVMVDNTRIYPGRLYNEQFVQNTYTSFGRLRALKYTNIRFAERQVGDSTKLDCYVMLTKGKYKSITAELEGTNSAGDLGAAASLSFQHRNLFRGAETFTIKVRGAYEAITGLQGYNYDNYTEYGVETSLNFPSFMFPFLSSDFKRRIRATSEVGIQFNSQIRPEFARTVASASWSYKWTKRLRAQHKVDLVDINYVYMPWISDKFKKEYIDSLNNSILKYNYENLLIVRTGYSFNFNSAGGGMMGSAASANSYSIRANIETAGNLFYAFSKMLKQHRNDDGKYSVWNIAYAQYIKGDFDFAKNITIDARNSFAFHFGMGVAYPYGNSDILPFEKRYFSGGANSVRGWSVRALGPGSYKGEDRNIDFMNQSGDIKLDMNVEYRSHLFWKLHGAVFVDAGNIWTIRNYKEQPGGQFHFNSFYKQIAVAYGLGLRFDFDFFVLRFDGGMKAINPAYRTKREHYPIIHPKFSRDFAFHFAVGYPF